jgi:hypothetical protein
MRTLIVLVALLSFGFTGVAEARHRSHRRSHAARKHHKHHRLAKAHHSPEL